MNLATTHSFEVRLLSDTSQKMLGLRELVLEEWKRRVRNSAQETTELREPAFSDTIPPSSTTSFKPLLPTIPNRMR